MALNLPVAENLPPQLPQEELDLLPPIDTNNLAYNWSHQHEVYAGDHWARGYWNAYESHHRQRIIQALEQCPPFGSILEVGCCSGPNLRLIHKRWPQVDLAGWDVNRAALEFGTQAAEEEGWGWQGYHGDLRDLPQLGPGVADIVLTCYALTYIEIEYIQPMLEALWEAARVGVVLAEPSASPEFYLRPRRGLIPEYHYDYQSRLARLPGAHKGLLVTPVNPPEGRLVEIVAALK